MSARERWVVYGWEALCAVEMQDMVNRWRQGNAALLMARLERERQRKSSAGSLAGVA